MRIAAFLAGLLLATPAVADMYQDASNSKTDTAFRFGTGLYPQYAQAVTTTANTTNGSPNITVANPAGILVGDSISAMSPSFSAGSGIGGTWVTAIAGNVVTISNNANSTNTAASVTFGVDRFVPGKTLMTDVLAASKGYFGAAAKGHSTWVNKHWAGADYPSLISVFGVSENANQGGMFATRASDNPGSTWIIALGSLLVDDGASGVRSTWNNYWQSDLTGSPGTHIQTESSIYSHWTPVQLDPYTKDRVGGTENLRLDCGVVAGSSQNCSAAMQVAPNNAKYLSGIIFSNNSVEGAGGPVSPAIELPRQYSIDWYSPASPAPAGNRAWRLYSSATTGNALFDLSDGGKVNVSATTPNTQYNAPGGRIGQTGMVDGLNMAIDSIGGGATLLNNNGATNLMLSGAITYMFAPVIGFKAQPYTVASLPTCDTAATYTVAAVSDQLGVPTYRGALTGGGALRVPVFCNGTSWEAH